MVLLAGQHGTAGDHLDPLHEGCAAECFKTVAKWTHRVTDWEMNSYWVRKALVDAVAYPPGPVVVPGAGLPVMPSTQAVPVLVDRAADLLAAAQRPLIIAGDGVHWSGFRGPLLRAADTVLLVGLRAGELESWFEPPDWPAADRTTYLQLQETADELWLGLDSRVTVLGSSRLVLAQLTEALRARLPEQPVPRPEWLGELAGVRTAFAGKRATALSSSQGKTPIHTYEPRRSPMRRTKTRPSSTTPIRVRFT
ncbi:hypothetical protein [Amycolatopsis jejuensis]|uniref:hypothetical protein n=1 Tax=Amycolatopsis jejuensis TaxID=330084 RepID=UPI0005261D28|nr:hypothetical protein [Amycolatopsis jejuensis]